MKYVDKVLLPGEKVLYRASVHWIGYATAVFIFVLAIPLGLSDHDRFGLFLSIALTIIAVLKWLAAWIERATTEIALTTQRLIYKTGLIRSDTTEISLAKVESIDVKQSALGRILNYGELDVRGTGVGIGKMHRVFGKMHRVFKPVSLRNAISQQIEMLYRSRLDKTG